MPHLPMTKKTNARNHRLCNHTPLRSDRVWPYSAKSPRNAAPRAQNCAAIFEQLIDARLHMQHVAVKLLIDSPKMDQSQF